MKFYIRCKKYYSGNGYDYFTPKDAPIMGAEKEISWEPCEHRKQFGWKTVEAGILDGSKVYRKEPYEVYKPDVDWFETGRNHGENKKIYFKEMPVVSWFVEVRDLSHLAELLEPHYGTEINFEKEVGSLTLDL